MATNHRIALDYEQLVKLADRVQWKTEWGGEGKTNRVIKEALERRAQQKRDEGERTSYAKEKTDILVFAMAEALDAMNVAQPDFDDETFWTKLCREVIRLAEHELLSEKFLATALEFKEPTAPDSEAEATLAAIQQLFEFPDHSLNRADGADSRQKPTSDQDASVRLGVMIDGTTMNDPRSFVFNQLRALLWENKNGYQVLRLRLRGFEMGEIVQQTGLSLATVKDAYARIGETITGMKSRLKFKWDEHSGSPAKD
jgi:hypothetical protein